jgi:flavin-dependent dehydrogenase
VLCSGLLNREAQQSLGRELPQGVRCEPQRPELEYHDLDNRLRMSYDPRYLNMHRPAFDAWLRELARQAGARVEYNRRVSRATPVDGGVELKVGGGTLTARIAVDATGWRALSRRQLSGGRSAQVHAFQGTAQIDLPEASMWAVFHSATTPFYGWIVPKGGGRFLIGAGFAVAADGTRDAKDDPWAKLAPFTDYLQRLGHRVEPLDEKPCGSPVTTPQRMNELWWGRGGVLPVGEAAGLVSPSSGDGISFCLQSAAALSSALLATDLSRLAYTPDGLSRAEHQRLAGDYRRRLRPALAELRFNMLKAYAASRPGLRGAAARLLPLYLRRPVQRLPFTTAA